MEQKNYYAFISYNEADEKWAEWLHRKLEYYYIPSRLCKEYPELPKKIRPVFLYRHDLSGTVLKGALDGELMQSQHLIVICSPNSAKSEWVNDEILSFIAQGKRDKIIPFIVEGEPNAENEADECFPPALRDTDRAHEIRGIEANRKEGRIHALVDVIATMFGVRFDTLWQRHRRRKRRLVMSGIGFLLTMMIGVIGFFAYVYNQEKKRLTLESQRLASVAMQLSEDGNKSLAIRLLLYALPKNLDSPDRPLDKFAESIFRSIEKNLKSGGISVLQSFSTINTYDFSPDGNLAAINFGNKVRIWDIESGREYVTLTMPEERGFTNISKIRFSDDGSHLYVITPGHAEELSVYDVHTGKRLHAVKDFVHSAGFDEKGDCIAIIKKAENRFVVNVFTGDTLCKLDNVYKAKEIYIDFYMDSLSRNALVKDVRTISVADLKTGRNTKVCDDSDYAVMTPSGDKILILSSGKLKVFEVSPSLKSIDFIDKTQTIRRAQISPDGKYVVVAAAGKGIGVWDLVNGRYDVLNKSCKGISDIDISPDSKNVAIIYRGNKVKIWNLSTREELHHRIEHTNKIRFIRFVPHKNLIVTFDKGCAYVWNIESNKEKAACTVNNSISAVNFNNSGDKIVISAYDSTPYVFDLIHGTGDFLFHPKTSVKYAEFGADDDRLLTVSGNKLYLWKFGSNWRVTDSLKTKNSLEYATFSPDGKTILSDTYGGACYISHIDDSLFVRSVLCERSVSIQKAIFSPDGAEVLTSYNDSTIYVWDVATGVKKDSLKLDGIGYDLAFSNDSRLLAVAQEKGVYVYDTKTWMRKHPINFPNKFRIRKVKISPYNKYVAICGSMGALVMVDLSRVSHFNLIHKGVVVDAEFSADGEHVITRSDNCVLSVWDIESRERVMSVSHFDEMRLAKFSPDGQKIVVANGAELHRLDFPSLENLLERYHKDTEHTWSLTDEEKIEYGLKLDGK